MGIIERLKKSVPLGGEPQANIDPSEFNLDQDGEGEDGNDDGNQGEEEGEEQNSSGSGEEQDDGEEEESGGGSGNEEEESEEGDSEEENLSGGSGEEEGEEEGEGNENDSGSESGNNSENGEDGDLDDLKDKMDDASKNRDMSEWNDTGEDYEDPSRFIKRNYEKVQEARADPETQIGKRKSERDERQDTVHNVVTAEELENEYEDRFADEISEAFRKIKTRSAPKASEHGQRVNIRNVVRKRSGDPTEEKLYLEMEPSEVGDRCITVVVDGSGSMDELEVKLALMAIADATEQIGDRFAATAYDTESTRGSGSKNVRTNLITGPTEQFDIEHTESFTVGGLTPTSSGIEDGRSISDITPNSEDVVIVITDGIANVGYDGTMYDEDNYQNPAMEQSSEQVKSAINEGKRVIGLGVGRYLDDKAMREIFGRDYIRADMDEIAEKLVEIYREQMETAPA